MPKELKKSSGFPDEMLDKLLTLTSDKQMSDEFPEYSREYLRKVKREYKKKYNLTPHGKINRQLTLEESKALLTTPEEDWKIKFPNMTRTYLRHEKRKMLELSESDIPSEVEIKKLKTQLQDKNKKIDDLLDAVDALKKEKDAVLDIGKPIKINQININKSRKKHESTAVMVASDWHIEEPVDPESVNHKNEFDLDIAQARSEKFFQVCIDILNVVKKDYNTNNVILALLGDFISNTIHDELMENNLLLPGDAIWHVQNMIASGIEFVRKNIDKKIPITIVCKSGNHGRMTKKQRISTEAGNSLETYMYRNLRNYFLKDKSIKFVIEKGYHTYIDVYGFTLRFHHGHSIRFGGGVGGITIPVNKAIKNWNEAQRADIDIFGHFHQYHDGGNFVCNGSLIGYNEYAINIKAKYERPKQSMFLVDSDYGKTITTPIVLD